MIIGQNKKINEINYNSLDIEDLEGEIWKDIPEFEGYYKASNYGRIKGFIDETFKDRKYERIIGGCFDKKKKCLRFDAIKNGQTKYFIINNLKIDFFNIIKTIKWRH
ncbi:MAG: NUMOD4 domain-containing protein [Nanoarchaeota archaeon]